jgi:hypothetical protein
MSSRLVSAFRLPDRLPIGAKSLLVKHRRYLIDTHIPYRDPDRAFAVPQLAT